jgi:hypothetical protein
MRARMRLYVLDSMPIPPKAMRGCPAGEPARRDRETAAVRVAADAFVKKDRLFTFSFPRKET